jgi:uncharacterized protein (DUF2236 family)
MSLAAEAPSSPIHLPWPLADWLSETVAGLSMPAGARKLDLTKPAGEAALMSPDSVSWRVFNNAPALFIGGIAGVVLELAEPRVRSGIWNHTSFRTDPATRLRRTGAAAMITVYGARSQAEATIAHVNRMHARVEGTTPAGVPYAANDPELLDWVQATAAYGFLAAYHSFVRPLTGVEQDRYYAEGVEAARMFGGSAPPASRAERETQFQDMRPRLEASQIIFDFLDIMAEASIMPPLLRPVQSLLVRGAIDILPAWAKPLLRLEGRGLRPFEAPLLRRLGSFADRVVIKDSPAAQACRRLGLPADYLHRR